MLQKETADDYVLATGVDRSVKEFLDFAFTSVDLDYRNYYQQDPRFIRPAEVSRLVGNPTYAKQALNWSPKVTVEQLTGLMVQHDLAALRDPTPANT